MATDKHSPRGGHGGIAEVTGNGTAIGGNGGRGGAPEFGTGGDGGGGRVVGDGYVRGGDGGDSGRQARPALGAVSPLAYQNTTLLNLPGMVDIYGIPQPGKGGDSHLAYVRYCEREYCLNILLQLLRGPVPVGVSAPKIIDAIDSLAFELGINTEQEWWDLATQKYPPQTAKVMAYVRDCEGWVE